MDTLEKAKTALTKASQARLHEMEGLAKIAQSTHEHLMFVECIRRLNAHMKSLMENTIVLYGETILEASPSLVKTYEEGVDQELNANGYTPEIIDKILQLD
jgi:hypothetical protein